MRSAVLWFVLLSSLPGCAGSYSQEELDHLEARVGDANTRRMADALGAALRSHHLKEEKDLQWTAVARMHFDGGEAFDVGNGSPYDPFPGMTAAEQVGKEVLADGSDGRDVLVVAGQCGGSCECRHGTDYHFATDGDGRIWVVRLRVEWQDRTVHRSGSCGYGCGVQMPPEPASVYGLPAAFGGFADGAVVQEEVNVTCDQMIPAP